MSNYNPYPAYKDSGVEWIGEVPEHWEVKPIKIIASCNDDSLPESFSPDTPIRYVDISSVSHDAGIAEPEFMLFGDAPSRARRKARAGDVVVSTVRTYLKAVAAVDDAHADCVYSTGFAVLRPRKEHLTPEFLKWLALNELLIQAVESHSEGLSYPAINASELINLKTTLPSLSEQARIASILDRETARIDALIAKKTRFIELLKEKRQALITHAVTKGLDPNVKMKDSGVAWIGEVPEGWKVLALKRMGTLKGGNGFPPSMQGREGNEFPFYKVGDLGKSIDGMSLGETRHSISKEDAANLGATIFKPGALAWAKIGAALSLNRRRVIRSACCLDNNMTGFTPDASVASTTYCFYLLSSIDFSLHAKPGAVPSFSEGDQGELMVTCPSLEEQCGIVNFLDRETARIDALIAKTQHSIDLLKERRSAFITAAVTGQIDLREEA